MKPAAQTESIERLLRAGADGQTQAYAELLARVNDRLLRLARRMLRHYPRLRRWEQTDDILQTASVRLVRSLPETQPENAAAFWGLAALQMRRTLLDLARHHFGPEGAAAKHQSDPEMGMQQAHSAPDAEPQSLEAWSRFHEAVDGLAPDYRAVFDLTWYSGLTQPEIAAALGISVPTVQRRWLAAKLELHRILRGENPLA